MMNGELVNVMTDDKVRLDGFYSNSNRSESESGSVQSAIIVHGLSGNFYKSKLLKHFASALQELGINTLLVNTRGHDFLNSTPRMGRATTLGAAVEIIDESKYDLHAWVDFLVSRGQQEIMLLGHSLGAIKSLYAQAHLPHPNVSRLAAFSATKLSYDSLLASSGGERFMHWLNLAQQQVAEQRGDEFLFVDFPFPTWMSANAYLAKYSDGDKYNWLSFMDQITIPTLAVFGEREMQDNAAFKAMADDLRNISNENFAVNYVRRADHFYSACFEPATQLLIDWLQKQDSI